MEEESNSNKKLFLRKRIDQKDIMLVYIVGQREIVIIHQIKIRENMRIVLKVWEITQDNDC